MKQSSFLILLVSVVLIGVYFFWRQPKRSVPMPERQTLVVGTSSDFPPFSTRENDQIVGFDIDVITEIAHRLNKQLQIQDMPFETLLSAAQLGSIQVIAAGLSMTPERAQQILFAHPHYSGDPLVMVSLRQKPVTSVDELVHQRVLVNEGYVADIYVTTKGLPHIIRLKTVADALLALQVGHADVFVTAYSTIKPFFDQKDADLFTYQAIPDTDEAYAFAISKKYPELARDIDRVIQQMIQDGTIEQFKKKWGLSA